MAIVNISGLSFYDLTLWAGRLRCNRGAIAKKKPDQLSVSLGVVAMWAMVTPCDPSDTDIFPDRRTKWSLLMPCKRAHYCWIWLHISLSWGCTYCIFDTSAAWKASTFLHVRVGPVHLTCSEVYSAIFLVRFAARPKCSLLWAKKQREGQISERVRQARLAAEGPFDKPPVIKFTGWLLYFIC